MSPFWEITNVADVYRDGDAFEVIGRLAPNRTFEDARAEMRLIAARLRDTYEGNRNLDVRVTPLSTTSSAIRRSAACGRVRSRCSHCWRLPAPTSAASSVRAMRRRQELAVRSALGAGRWRMIRQLLAESVVLWAIASTGGVALAYGLMRLLLPTARAAFHASSSSDSMPSQSRWRSLVDCSSSSSAARSVPRRHSVRSGRRRSAREISRVLRGRVYRTVWWPRKSPARWCSSWVRCSLLRASRAQSGGSRLRRRQPDDRAPRAAEDCRDGASWARFVQRGERSTETLPESSASAHGTSSCAAMATRTSRSKDASSIRNAPRQRLTIEGVTPGFFDVAGIELVEGRMFDERDLAAGAAPVFIVNESIAR